MNILTKSEKMEQAWKIRKDYIGADVKSSLYTTWRAIVFTKKGKQKGFPEKWKTFFGFKEDVISTWCEGKILVRLDKQKPYSIENTCWVTKGSENSYKMIKLEYKGETKTIIEWCYQFGLNFNGVRQRYHRGKNYSVDQVLFGKYLGNRKEIRDYNDLNNEQNKKDKISKMLSAYKCKDKKRNKEFNLDKDFFEKEILSKPCVYCGDNKVIGCDRIDNNKGHTKDNVVPCCYTCNCVRNNLFTLEEMKQIGQVIKDIKHKRTLVVENL